MSRAVLNSMTDAERLLVAETERDAIADLPEDDLLDLHSRVRRARTKYVKNYRQAASAKVEAVGGRGKGFEQNSRDRDKAEVFELALARVSRQVAVRANQAAAELKAERLAAARERSTGPDVAATPQDGVPAGRARQTRKTTGGIKKDASSRSAGARRQAKRDAR
ncbi:MAG TPA: hypothetical protein VMF51_06865 [Nocardioides sp.]|uniref:hypothetical protein n=1 Tax=Nocardioides sp. TaxID=35761 RepID=UPI002D019EDA|nr:hypothetical protein [Nocardioides sp.]HTW14833.1 hypothetical protein [Nocardioides sp.]